MQIESFVPVKDHAHIQARFNVMLSGGFTVRDVKLMSGSKGRWISWPSRSYKDKEGKDKYFDYILLDKDLKEKIETELKSQLDKLLVPPKDEQPSLDEIPF